MPQMISIVGKSDSGKTTLMEKVISELKRRGYKIGTIKHSHHLMEAGEGRKDSDRHKKAGADTVILASRNRVFMVKDICGDNPDHLEMYFRDMDLVIAEGYKKGHLPKIEIFRKESCKRPLYPEHGSPHLYAALVTDADIPADIPVFGLENIQELSDFIENNFIIPFREVL